MRGFVSSWTGKKDFNNILDKDDIEINLKFRYGLSLPDFDLENTHFWTIADHESIDLSIYILRVSYSYVFFIKVYFGLF